MPIDEKAAAFLAPEGAPIQTLGPSTAGKEIHSAHALYKEREFMERSGGLYEEIMGFFLQQKKKHAYRDDECIAAIALFTINLREAYGRPQYEEEAARWKPEMRTAKLEEFDEICVQMQAYYDAEKDKP